jgi:hypothetical protein
MRRGMCVGVGVGVFLIVSLVTIQSAQGQAFSFSAGGFTTSNVCQNSGSPASTCQVLTNGIPNQPQVTSSGGLRLTTANLNQHGSAWYYVQQPLANGFTTAFQFQVSNTNMCRGCSFPADGLAFVIQNDPAGTGALGYVGDGQNIGYGNNDNSRASGPGEAILNSVAIELDTFDNSNYGDPNGNHIAVQSCGPNTPSALAPNSADHDYICPNGVSANLALQSLPSGLSISDGNIHTLTVNYLPPGTCTSSCNNLTVYFDSTQILQATVNLATQLNLASGSNAYMGFTAATGSLVQNNDIISWSYSQWPLSPITVTQPVQPTTPTNFNYTSSLSAVTDYSQSGLPSSSFNGLFMQGTVQSITDQVYSGLVANTPFQGSTCQHQFIGTDTSGNNQYSCVTTTDLCTNASSSTPAGTNCLGTTGPLINVSNTYTIDPAQKAVLMAPGYIMGRDDAISCGASADNTCKGLVSIFTGINGDSLSSTGHTNNFNSVLIPIFGSVQPSTSVTTNPPLNSGWTNTSSLTVNFNGTEIVPSNNTNPPATLPTVASIFYSASGANVPSPASNTITGASGSVTIPVTTQGTTTITYASTDTSNIVETLFSNNGTSVSSASPTFTFNVDLTAPTLTCNAPATSIGWQAANVSFQCSASDSGGSGLVGPSTYTEATTVPAGTETNNATIPALTVSDVAGNQTTQGPFGPYEIDLKPPVIIGPTISPASPVYGQQVTASFSCTDGGSGVVECGPVGSATFPATANTGTITANAVSTTGTHTFTVVAQDAVGNVSAPSPVTYTVGQATPVVTWATPAAISYGAALGVGQLNATANVPGTFAYSPTAGTTLGAGVQMLSVTFTPTDTTDYTTATASVQLLVNKASPTVTWAAPAAITYGTALSGAQLDATASVPGTFAYSPAAGTLLHAGTQTLSVTFTPTDANDYNPVTTTVTLTVNQAASVITWPGPAPISYGTALSSAQLDATANVAGTFVYSPAAGTVLHAGIQTLSVTFTPTDTTDYSSTGASVMLTVSQVAPVIAWATPAPISYGTALSGTQLDATASVAGTFLYTPAAGTILSGGTHTLSVVLTPTDAVDYTTATASVLLVVIQPQLALSPASINFGTAPLGSLNYQVENLTNTGNTTLKLTGITIVPGANTDLIEFTWLGDCGPLLPAGANCDLLVFFLADKVGSHSATLVISDNGAGSPQSVPLSANVVK